MSECLKIVKNQMANTFFGFNTSLNEHGDRLGSSPEDIEGLEAEEEYDALNDETFGALENEGDVVDWEVQHEQLAEIAESSRHSNDIETFLDQLGLNDEESLPNKDSLWTYTENTKNGDKFEPKLLSSVHEGQGDVKGSAPASGYPGAAIGHRGPASQPKLRTVEELERMLINQAKPGQTHGPRFPPGFQPLLLNSGGWQGGVPPGPPPNMPPGMVRVMGGRPPPGFVPYQQPGYLPPHFNFPPPPRLPPNLPPGLLRHKPHPNHFPPNHNPTSHLPHQHAHPLRAVLHHQQHHGPPVQPQLLVPQPQGVAPSAGSAGGDTKDEYAGLMNNREKQWLLNIQLLQVNTGTPYFDDYYYTVFKERQTKNKETQNDSRSNHQRYHRAAPGRGHNHNHQEQQNPVKKTYTPLQFENSLGKLQFGSVTAPRKIIDMDIIATSDTDTQVTSRDSRKTKQLLLELEVLYSLLLKAEDLRNPVAIANQEKLVELRQKQRLREMDAAPTPEQKQEVLKLLQAESVTVRETPRDLLCRLLSGLLDTSSTSDRLTSFLAVRKGKLLVLRALPQLAQHPDVFHAQLHELWARVLAALAVVGRRDTSGDNVLVRLHPYFKKFINTLDMDDILDLLSNLTEIIKPDNNRSTPLSHQSKAPVHFILQNKFGVSAIATILSRVDGLLDSNSSKQQSDWSAFLTCLIDALLLVGPASSSPLEPISDACLARHVQHGALSPDKRQTLEKVFLD